MFLSLLDEPGQFLVPEELKNIVSLAWLLRRAGTEQLNRCYSCSGPLLGFKQVWCSKGQVNLFFGGAVKFYLNSSWPHLFKHWTLLPQHSKNE